ncbi:MAG: WYL domain-containing protein [Ruminococcus sp.]|nr:WYL domain-containing protein [Ruminococcus sp.]
MAERTTGTSQRLRLIYLQEIFKKESDAEHRLSLAEITKKLERYGISIKRKALYEDINSLILYGMNINSTKGKYAKYWLEDNEFELAELKLLADSVCSAKFLTQQTSEQLLKKIEGLASVHQAKQIQRQVYVTNRVKSDNEMIYKNVDVLHEAIKHGNKVSFSYFDYDINMDKKFREGARVCSPYALTWDNGNYYLVGYYEKYNDITSFRVDRMGSAFELNEPCVEKPSDFDMGKFSKSTFSMFNGERVKVRMRFEEKLMNSVIDRFGKDVHSRPDGENHFVVSVDVKPQPPFFAWLFQFGGSVEILSPKSVKDMYVDLLKKTLECQ